MSAPTTHDQQLRSRDLELIGKELAGLNLAGQLTAVLHRAADSIAAFDEASSSRPGSWEADLEDALDRNRLAAVDADAAELLCAVSRQLRRGGPFDRQEGDAPPR